MTGKTISHYKILEKLGEGGMGVVYKAEDTKLHRLVALKFLPPHLTKDRDTIERFVTEARAASTLDHPNICTIYEINETDDGQMFISMAYYSGQILRDKITENRLPIAEAVNIAMQIAAGLAKAHDKNIIHRDIKPGNVMVPEDGPVKIIDFGISKLLGITSLTKSGQTLGTLSYMSPEQVLSRPVDHRSDIWSLGVILYEMLTGELPFKGEYEIGMMYSISNVKPEPLTTLRQEVPMELEQIVNRALSKDPSDRYQRTDEFIVDLHQIKKDSETKELLSKAGVSTNPPQKKKRSFVVPGIIAMVIVVVIVGYFFFSAEDETFPTDPEPIAVLPFENLTGNTEYDIFQKSIANLFIAKLEQSKYMRVTTWERMHDLLKQIGEENIEVVDIREETGFKLCRMDGVSAAVTGSYSKIGNTFAIEVKVLDVSTKKILVSETSNGEGENSIFSQIDDLAKIISKGIGISQRKVEDSQRAIADVTTNSMEAYNYFIRGKAEFEKRYFQDAVPLLKRAIELDSTFAMAYLYLGRTIGWMGYVNARREAFKKAKEYSYKTTQKELLYIEASYADKIERNSEKRNNIYKEIAKKYPNEKQAHYQLGRYYSFQNRYDEAIEQHKIALKLDPNYGISLNQLGYIYSEMGDFQTAMSYFEQYAMAAPGEANPYNSMAALYFKMGKINKAIVKYNEALHKKPDYYDTCWRIGYIYAFKEDYDQALYWVDRYYAVAPSENEKAIAHTWRGFYYYWLGSIEKSLIELEQADNLAINVGHVYNAAEVKWRKANIYNSMGEYDRSRREFNNLFISVSKIDSTNKSLKTLVYNYGLAKVDLEEGKLDSAKYRYNTMLALLPEIDPATKENVTMDINLFYGEVLLAMGHDISDETINAYEEIFSREFSQMWTSDMMYYNEYQTSCDLLARAYIQKGNINKAIDEYERLITRDLKNKNRRLIYPKLYYRLAKLYHQTGKKDKAILNYQKFLNIWKNAANKLPELTDAKKRLAQLTQVSVQ